MPVIKKAFFTFLTTIIFGLVSYYYASSAYNLGSNESSGVLSKKTSIINWQCCDIDTKGLSTEIFDPESFLNFTSQGQFHFLENTKTKPSFYFKGKEQIYPIFLQTRTGALPHFLAGVISRSTSPRFGLIAIPWVMSIIIFCAIISILLARDIYLGLAFFFTSVLTPQFVYFINPFFPDSYSSFSALVFVLILFNLKESKTLYVAIGFLLGMALYFKLASAIIFPLFLIFYPEKIFKNFKFILIGLVPIALFMAWLINWNDLIHFVSYERRLLKGTDFFKDTVGYFTFYSFAPSLVFLELLSLKPQLPTLGRPVFIINALIFLSIMILCLRPRDVLKILLFIVLYVPLTTAVVSEIGEDLLDFMAQGILIILFVAFLRINVSRLQMKQGLFILAGLFLVFRALEFSRWNQKYQEYKGQFGNCSWAYECMVEDWKKKSIVGKAPLLTLFYLDVGQIEYYSQETILPMHAFWKYSTMPSPQTFKNFIVNFPYNTFYILSSTELGVETGLEKYFKLNSSQIRTLFSEHSLEMRTVGEYNYPLISRSYRLLELKRTAGRPNAVHL